MKKISALVVIASFLTGQMALAYPRTETHFPRMQKWAEKLNARIEEKYQNASEKEKHRMLDKSISRMEKRLTKLEAKSQEQLDSLVAVAKIRLNSTTNSITPSASSTEATEESLDADELSLMSEQPAPAEALDEVKESDLKIDKDQTVQGMKKALVILKTERESLATKSTKTLDRQPASHATGYISASIFLGVSVSFVISGGVLLPIVVGLSLLVLGVLGVLFALSLFARVATLE